MFKDPNIDMNKPMFGKSRGNSDRLFKFAEGPSANSVLPDLVQLGQAAWLFASLHRTGSNSNDQFSQADFGQGSDEGSALIAVPGFPDFQNSSSLAFPPAPAGISSEV